LIRTLSPGEAKKRAEDTGESKQEIGITSKSMQKVATVTGAARGIGLGTVKRFLVDGWRVALLDIDEETLNRSAADLHTDAVLPICCDVADAAGVTKAFSEVAQTFGRLDVLGQQCGHSDLQTDTQYHM
jgi:NAD(P)-dependent dehydrogenase (short-subunit alcohol dehydrogenase family)